MLPVMGISCAESDSGHGMVPSVLVNIPAMLQDACALAALVTRSVHGSRLCEADANSVQIGFRPICHPNH
ncbi:Uncharacterised protein [Yersinia enterocolitica]|nr:Uncharacterised protein [Yersinia enterocolitica]SUP65557.1 Uncharacterised protein [Yersinia enterocolitica]